MHIYLITNKLNGKTYVGQTIQNPKDRWDRHCSTNPGNMRIGDAIIRNGKENFTFEVIDSASSFEELDKKEQEWIRAKNSVRNGYNSTYGGNKCHNQTEESNAKRSEKLKGKPKLYCRKPVICVTTGQEFLSQGEACRFFGLRLGTIAESIRKNYRVNGELTFRYKET